jgi:hypothetical protein
LLIVFILCFEGPNFASIYKKWGDGQPDVFNRNRLEVCVAKKEVSSGLLSWFIGFVAADSPESAGL